MDRLYRFELSFDGERQDVGMFHGLDGTGLRPSSADRLSRLFDGLLLADLDDRNAVFWFTQDGLREFPPSILKLRASVRRRGWDLVMAVLPDRPDVRSSAVYEDAFQVALSGTDVPVRYEPFPARRIRRIALGGEA